MGRQMESSVKNMVIVLAAMFFQRIAAYPNGAVTPACGTLEPNHGTTAQQNSAPYSLILNSTQCKAGGNIKVTLRTDDGATGFKGFLIQCRSGNDPTPIGSFTVTNADAQLLTCTSEKSAVSHTSSSLKNAVEVIWSAPDQPISQLSMRAAVVQAKNVYWVNVTSEVFNCNSGSHLIPGLAQILLVATILIFSLLRD